MYVINNDARDFRTPRKVILKRQSSTVSPIYQNDYDADDISVESYDRSLSPRENTTTPSKIKIIRTHQLSPRNTISTAKDITSPSWYKSTKGWMIVAGILSAISIIVILPTVLAVILTRNPLVGGTTTTTTTATTIRTASWNFDGTANDLNGTFNGTLGSGASFNSITYYGYGFSLVLNGAANSFVSISSSFFNLSYTSFTVEGWIYLLTTTGDNAIFSQCECGGCQSRCLSLIVRSGKLYMAFSPNVLIGTASVSANTWYHVAYVYDYSSRTQSVYLQGVLDATKSSSDPYQGQSGVIFIGASNLSSSLYNGYIDDLKVTTMAKSSSDLLDDATLMSYFSFDSLALTDDVGPNKISGYLQNAAGVSGKVGQALSLSGASSYFQAYAFYALSQTNREFSIALWINPNLVTGTLVQKTRGQFTTTGSCSIFMVFSTVGQIIFAVPITAFNTFQIVGPVITIGSWTHLGYTYSPTNGITMYINGVKYGSTGNLTYYSPSNNYEWINVGEYTTTTCTNLVLTSNGYYQGSIDELYVYRRELRASTIASLANY